MFYNLGPRRCNVFPVKPDKLDSKVTYTLFIKRLQKILRRKDCQTNEKQMQLCSNLLTSRMRYDES